MSFKPESNLTRLSKQGCVGMKYEGDERHAEGLMKESAMFTQAVERHLHSAPTGEHGAVGYLEFLYI